MNRSKLITGQVIFRDSGEKTNDGRRLMMVVGIVAAPEGVDIKTEHQYALCSEAKSTIEELYGFPVNQKHIRLALSKSGRDVSGETHGSDMGQLLTYPIWRY